MKLTILLPAALLLRYAAIAQVNNTPEFKAYDQAIPNSTVSFKMVPVPAGSFLMGSPAGETGRQADEGPQKTIQLSAFWMEEHEVTYDEFLLFFNDENTSRNSEVDAVTRPTTQYIDLSWGMGKQGGFPVNSMSQHTAIMYCRWLYQKTGIFYRLPTEAEWEYACRAGSTTTYYYGDDVKQLKDYAWYNENSRNKYQKIKLKKPNSRGLYDMLGNVSEWTLDQYKEDYLTTIADKATDPCIVPTVKYPRAVRGGGYTDNAVLLRCASRNKSDVSWNRRDPQVPKSKWWLTDAMAVGFRVVRPLLQPSPAEADEFFKKFTGN